MRMLMVFRNHGLVHKHRCQSKVSKNHFVSRIIVFLVGNNELNVERKTHPF